MRLMRPILIWGVMLIAIICNGFVREAVLKARVGELRASQISVTTGCVLILLITAASWRWMGIKTAKIAWTVGAVWVALTLAFEFLFGHFVSGLSWGKLLEDYNVARGRLWPLVLITTLVAAPVMQLWSNGELIRQRTSSPPAEQ